MKRQVIINADDFGWCSGVNRGIKQAHNEGVLTSATIMAGMPGAEEAVQMAKQMPQMGVGVHLNLLEGQPVSPDKGVGPLLNSTGQFAFSAEKLAMMSLMSRVVRKAIEIELTAQIEWLIYNGIKPTHLDSHKHVHMCPLIYRTVVALAERFDIGAIRWPFEPGRLRGSAWPGSDKKDKRRACVVSMMAKINRRQNDAFIKNDAFLGLTHTGRIENGFWKAVAENAPAGVMEVMTHPGYRDGLDPSRTRLIEHREAELEALCSEQTKKYLADANIEVVHYGKI